MQSKHAAALVSNKQILVEEGNFVDLPCACVDYSKFSNLSTHAEENVLSKLRKIT